MGLEQHPDVKLAFDGFSTIPEVKPGVLDPDLDFDLGDGPGKKSIEIVAKAILQLFL